MKFDGKTNDEVFKELQKLSESGERLTIEILDLAVSSRSVEDKYARPDALTVFYSGENDEFVKSFVENNPHIRNIKHTEAYAFIDDIRFNDILKIAIRNSYPNLSVDEIKTEVNRRLRETSDNTKNPYIKGIGYWTEVSRKFAEETRGDSYAFISRSSFEKIFGSDELRCLIESPYTDTKICDIDKEILKQILKLQSLRDAYDTVKKSVLNDLYKSIEYYNSSGEKLGQNFTGTSLESRFNDTPPNNYYFKTTLGEYLPYCDYEKLTKKYPDLNAIQEFNKKSRFTMALIAYEYLKATGVTASELTALKKEYDEYIAKLHRTKELNYTQTGGKTVTNNANKKLIEQARQADLLNYFQTSGYTVEKRSDNYYVKEIAGLCIKPEKNQWYYHYGNVGRTNNSLDCLTLVLGRSFIQSVYELTGQDISKLRSSDYPKEKAPQYTAPPKYEVKIATEKKELKMPEAAQNMRRLFAYFCQSRKIPSKVIEELAHAKLLYQSENTVKAKINGVEQTFNNANAVFVHKNKNGEVIGGEIQGLNSYKRYKGIASGTGDSAFQFMPNPSADGKPKRAYLFESAIDLMSFYALCDKSKIEGALFVSMAGLKPTVPKQLEAEGIKIISCVDNDDAGRRFEEENGFVRSEGVKRELDEKGYKDWNELLVSKAEKSEIDLIRNDNNIENNNNNTPRKSLEKDTPNLPENPPPTIGGMGGRR